MKLKEPLTIADCPYDNASSADIAAPFALTKAEFIEVWLDSDIPFEPVLARDLPPVIEMLFNYCYFYEPEDGTIIDFDFQGADFATRLLGCEFSDEADNVAKATLTPVAEQIEGLCVNAIQLIYDAACENN